MKPGEGATYNLGTDQYPVTIRKVSASGHAIWVSKDQVRANPGGSMVFIPVDRPEKDWDKFTRRDDGKYRPVGKNFGYLSPGRESYRDPHL